MSERRETAPPTTLSSTRGRWTMLAVILGSGIVFLDTSVVNLALKAIGQELPRRFLSVLEGQSYIVNGYFLTLSALLILAGALTDYHGRRLMFGVGLVGFGVTSALCGLAPTMELLVVFRVLQGAAGAMLVPGSLSIITSTFDGEDRGRAFGVWAGASAATTILGPFVGGVLVNAISWRAVFLVNIPLVLLAYFATLRHVPESRDEEAAGRFDWLGAVIVFLAVGGLSFGTIRGQQQQWQDLYAFVALGLGGLMVILFPIRMARSRHPLVPLHLFRSRNFSVTNISTFVIYGALYVILTFLNLFMLGTLGYNEPAAGLGTVPMAIFLALFSTKFGKLAARHGPRLFMAGGPAIMAAGILLFTRIPPESEPWVLAPGSPVIPPSAYFIDFLPGLVVFGIGLMIMVAPLTTALMTSVPARHSGVASAINNAISRVGAPIIGAVIFVAVSASFYAAVADRVPEADTSAAQFRRDVAPLNPPPPTAGAGLAGAVRVASTDSFHRAMIVAAVLLLAGAAVNAAGIRNLPQPETPEAARVPPPAAPAEGQVSGTSPPPDAAPEEAH